MIEFAPSSRCVASAQYSGWFGPRLSRATSWLRLPVRGIVTWGDRAMEVNGKRLLVCDCNGTMPLDGKALAAACAGGRTPHADLEIHTFLCRTQLAKFEAALREERPVIVACTQEAPLFTEARAEAGLDTDIRFVNIREHAGWSDEATRAVPKMTALLAEAAFD